MGPKVHNKTQRLATGVLWLVGIVNLTQAAAGQSDDEKEIRALADRWTAAYVAGDKAGVLDVYTSDAWIMPNERPHLQGHDAIGARLDALIGGPKFQIDIDIQEIRIVGDFAWAVAHYVITVLDEAGAAAEEEFGTGVTIYRRDGDGRWRILRDMDNRRLPD